MGAPDFTHTKLTEQDTQAITTAYRAAADHLLRRCREDRAELVDPGLLADECGITVSDLRTRRLGLTPAAAALVASILAVCIALSILTQDMHYYYQSGMSLPAALWALCSSPWWRW